VALRPIYMLIQRLKIFVLKLTNACETGARIQRKTEVNVSIDINFPT